MRIWLPRSLPFGAPTPPLNRTFPNGPAIRLRWPWPGMMTVGCRGIVRLASIRRLELRDFMEMRMVDSTEIWSRSIEECATHPLTAYAISRHFCYLAEQVRDGGRSDPDDLEAVDHFLERQADVEASLSEAASTANQGEAFERLARNGVSHGAILRPA